MNPLFRLLAAAAFALALVLPAFAAEVIFPPGSRVGLVPPPGMTPSARLQGFEDTARGAVVAITELDSKSYAKMAKEFSAETMQAGGMEVLKREDYDLPGGPALIVAARQQTGGVMMRKWALAGIVDDLTVVVVVSMPEAAIDAYPDAAVRAALMSVTVRAKLSADEMLAVLPYRLPDLGGFHLMRTTPDGTAVLTFGPNDTGLPVEQPYFVVITRAGEMPLGADPNMFAQRAFAEFSARAPGRIVSSEPIRIGGVPGHQIIAESKDGRTGDDLTTVQWLRFGAGSYIQMLGIARKDQWDTVLPRMRAIRDGFGVK